MNNICQECGMVCRTPTEYHPYAACLMFKACHDGDTVRANLDAVRTSPAPGAPAGFKLVPIEPTTEMIAAGQEAQNRACYQKPQPVGGEWGVIYYRAMLDAAPGAPGQEAAAVQAVGAWQDIATKGGSDAEQD